MTAQTIDKVNAQPNDPSERLNSPDNIIRGLGHSADSLSAAEKIVVLSQHFDAHPDEAAKLQAQLRSSAAARVAAERETAGTELQIPAKSDALVDDDEPTIFRSPVDDNESTVFRSPVAPELTADQKFTEADRAYNQLMLDTPRSQRTPEQEAKALGDWEQAYNAKKAASSSEDIQSTEKL